MMEALKMENRMGNRNDDRLGELSGRVDEGFSKVDERFEKVPSKEELKEVKGELRHLSERIDRLLHAFAVVAVTFGIGVLATLGGVVAALL